MHIKRWRLELIGLIFLATITRLWTLKSPNAVVFDEVYFKAFAAHYLDNHFAFDIHPPLGKLVLAGGAHLLGLSSNSLLQGTALPLRIIPALAGILLVPLMWAIMRRLGASRPMAFLGAFLVTFDNALLVESRFILTDSLLLLFGLSAVYAYLVARSASGVRAWIMLSLAATAAGAALSTKWTGLNALAIIGITLLYDQHRTALAWPKRIQQLAILTLLPILIYVASFAVHFALLTKSGDGDAFMSHRFQQTLIGNPNYDPRVNMSFFDEFVELNKEMFKANQTLTATHPYGSRWYTWPLEQRPIYYWQGETSSNGQQGNIYLLGNPVVWWGIWLAIIIGLFLAPFLNRPLRSQTIFSLSLAVGAYFINLLPFVAVSRVMFLYHYFFAFLFSLIAAVLLWNDLATPAESAKLNLLFRRSSYGAILLAVLAGFIYFAPLSYGSPLTPQALQARMWLPTWR